MTETDLTDLETRAFQDHAETEIKIEKHYIYTDSRGEVLHAVVPYKKENA